MRFKGSGKIIVVLIFLVVCPSWASQRKERRTEAAPPDLLLEGGRKLTFERSISTEADVVGKKSFWSKFLDVVAGQAPRRFMIRPYSIAVDSRGRAIVTDPGAKGVHIFDLQQHKYSFIQRAEKEKDPMLAPQCVAVDDHDNIYVTDSESGKIFVFEPSGKFHRAIGSIKRGEGFFKRPTGISIDSAAKRIYVTDTLRNKVFVLDMNGEVLQTIGQTGAGNLEFNVPTEVLASQAGLIVVDAMNFRVQLVDPDGSFHAAIGKIGDSMGTLFRPKGIALDSEDHLYIADGFRGIVQVFNREGQLLYHFGQKGPELGEFQLPAGLFIDKKDRVFVVDSYNQRVQVFQYYGISKKAAGGQP